MADEGPPHVVFSVVVQQDGITEVKNFRLRRGEAQAVKIGKGPANDVVVTHTGCSTQHAEIRLQDDDGIAPKLVVRDLSVNGTGVQRSGSTKTHGLEKDVDTPLEEGYLLFMPYRLKVKSTDPTSRVWLRVSRLKTHSSSASGSKRPREEQPDAQREEAATGRPLQAFAKRRSAPAGAVDGGSLEASDAKPSLQAHAKRRAAPPGGQAAQADGQEKPALVAYAKRRSAPHGTRRDADVEDGVANRAQSSSSRPVLRPAMRVVLTGLRAAPQLNGTGGLLEQFDEEANRWNVMLDGGDVKAVRAQNLLPEASAGKSQATGQQKSPTAESRPVAGGEMSLMMESVETRDEAPPIASGAGPGAGAKARAEAEAEADDRASREVLFAEQRPAMRLLLEEMPAALGGAPALEEAALRPKRPGALILLGLAAPAEAEVAARGGPRSKQAVLVGEAT
eukprot:CAMPEP_0178374312 /NCGR_PEP_ID=MMETSP0689_2-20121128/2311_1 /TAXON_ID=160604 /ORGANISM="Amphidinium massartii, Strain CS-259" /LENGTH=449 /DNA_ID=CAMNT_0019994277 /DNA_START=46 /DNA_END=1393 /DNA_ORIENTATION=+